jgi:Fe-only nitrogenase accessory protein AnfO
MIGEIAVLLDEKNKITSFDHLDKINIFYQINNQWMLKEQLVHILIEGGSVGQIQKSVLAIIDKLNGCKIVLGSIITGVPFHVLDRKGIIMCESDDYSDQIFNEIMKDQLEVEMKLANKNIGKEEFKGPKLMDEDGVFFLDLINLQKTHPEISSKKAIIPFLTNIVFYELQVVCDHVMPWLEGELRSKGLEYVKEPYDGNKIKLTITHCRCRDI